MTSMSQLDELPHAQRNKCYDGAAAVTICSKSHRQHSLCEAPHGLPCG